MKKARVVLIIFLLFTFLLVGLIIKFIFFWPSNLTFEPMKVLPKDRAIEIRAKADDFGMQKGDTFSYFIEIWYNPDLVEHIDKESLNRMINLEPFEIRDIREREFYLDTNNRVYQKEYQLQLLNGQVNSFYELPTIIVRYKSKGSADFSEESFKPYPIFIASRLPSDLSNLSVSPVKEKLINTNHLRISWIFLCLGGILLLAGLANFFGRITQWREEEKHRREIEGYDLFSESYRSLKNNIKMDVEPQYLFHQIDHILRALLARKEKIGWLEDPDLQALPSEIKEKAISLLEICQKAYRASTIEQKEADEVIRQLEVILDFYYKGERGMCEWKT
ncbi:MAG: hypothetical protein E4G71_02365 [Candidatus Atribacteria bacterium]|nr:MAG: hypothetical protein E4G71_02365 [Candidatus Atribacteria bacterium]